MKTAWKAAVALCSLVVVSCGGGGGNAAVSKTFNYGASQTPSTAEQGAATSAQGTVSDTAAFGTSPDSTKATAIISLADDLASSALGGAAIPAALAQDPALRRTMRAAATIPACTTATATSVTFSNCTIDESGYAFTLNGSVSATNGIVVWDISGGLSGTNQGISFSINIHQSGTLTVTSTTVAGKALSEISGNVSGSGQSINFGLSTAALVNLTYNADCVTLGTIEVKRVWSQLPNGATGSEFADVAVKLTWSGCNTLQVQHSI